LLVFKGIQAFPMGRFSSIVSFKGIQAFPMGRLLGSKAEQKSDLLFFII